ncbi:MAG: hypothetical protein IVW52_04875 [Acidimicrobiales bacterium]|nr:hypothetical protein [Acidimicrobiales bacterium]
MIGRCSACGALGEIDLAPVPNGAQRVLCAACTDGRGPPRLPGPGRFRVLVARLREDSLVPAEARDLGLALDELARAAAGAGDVRRMGVIAALRLKLRGPP